MDDIVSKIHKRYKKEYRRRVFRAMWVMIYRNYTQWGYGINFREEAVYYDVRTFYKAWFYDMNVDYINKNIKTEKKLINLYLNDIVLPKGDDTVDDKT